MIKSLHEITLRNVIDLDATKSPRSLMKYRMTPMWLWSKRLEKLCGEIFKSIGGESIQSIEKDIDQHISYSRLQILEALFKALSIELNLKSKINAWKIILDKDYKESEQLEKVLSEVQKHTGIKIESPDDYEEFTKYVQFRIDKHREMFPPADESTKSEGVPLTKVIYSVFDYMGQPLNEDMRLINFISMKEMAEDRIRSQKQQSDGQFE